MPVHETDEGADTRHTESGLYIALELFYVCYKKHFSRSWWHCSNKTSGGCFPFAFGVQISRSKQFPKCYAWYRLLKSAPTTAPLPRIVKELIKLYSIKCTITRSIHLHSTSSESCVGQPFCVMFLNARILRCQGCRGKIEQGHPSPGDIVLQHKEYVLFQNPRTGNWQMSKDLRNTYYHPRLQCIAHLHQGFSSSEMLVRDDVRQNLNVTHVSHLNTEFVLVL